jgi:hypothetical protein
VRRPYQYYLGVSVETIKDSSPRPKACCAECFHFFPTGLDEEAHLSGFVGCSVVGRCHRSAPVMSIAWGFPKVLAHSFCGDFQLVQDEKLPFTVKKK